LDSRPSSIFSYSSSSTNKPKHSSLPYSESDFAKGTKITNVPNLDVSYFWTSTGILILTDNTTAMYNMNRQAAAKNSCPLLTLLIFTYMLVTSLV
jgi:hypothetical protein